MANEEIVGKVIFSIPILGTFFLLIGTSRGLTAFVLGLFLLILLRYFSSLGNKYQEAEIKIGALLTTTQVIDGALSDEFGLSFKELTDVQTSTQSA